jgi:Ca-activated chloride channel family protein
MDDDNGIPVDGTIHPPYAAEVPYGLSISLKLHKGSILESIESPSHQIKIENLMGDTVHVTLSAESVRMDRDFILYMDYGKSLVTRAYRHHVGKEVFVQLDFLPDEIGFGDQVERTSDAENLKRVVVFLMDCSGSMEGDSIQEAKKALEICLRGLDQGSLFEIYRFGSTYESLFPAAVFYTEKTAAEALNYLENMNADLGGTKILDPLKEICSSLSEYQNSQRDIILLTDGQVGNENEIFELIKRNKRIRVFPVGIGAGCNEYFIKGLARSGNGASEFIYPGERIEPKVIDLFGKVKQEVVMDLAITWDSGSVEQAPAAPTVFMKSSTTVFARITGASGEKSSLKLKAKVNGQEMIWEIEIHDVDDLSMSIPTLWARERIRDLEESGDALMRGSRQRERKQGQLKERVVEISKNFGLLSQSTSFVAVEEREEKDKATGEVLLRKIPVPVTVGWHGIGGLNSRVAEHLILPKDVSPTVAPLLKYVENFIEPQLIPAKSRLDFSSRYQTVPYEQKALRMKEQFLFDLLSLQMPTGGMMLDEETARVFVIDLDNVHSTASQITMRTPITTESSPIDYDLLLSTAIVVALLEYHFRDDRNTWRPIIEKSKRWLEEIIYRTGAEIEGQDLTSWAETYVRHLPQPEF